uniref:SAM domain-containing protein n=1 Tax=Calcidiscus leptoporus TaxID=127549 RepID=A0A7S0IQH1_9EUKA|mmetsp:Transcript_16953/g.38790  ORF Transcript_16953/g.38790 Transcript_16953/m.38790 type:complete len:235 (+) Transcript_16953:26-730(+)
MSGYVELLEVHPRKSVEVEGDALAWSTRQVCEWLSQLQPGLDADAIGAFAAHHITGDLLHSLTEEHLEKMGVGVIGQRLVLLREMAKLRRKARAKKRFEVLWEAHGVPYKTAYEYLQYKLCGCCMDKPDHYKLTHSSLVLTQKDYSKASGIFSRAKHTRIIDLDTVEHVAVHSERECCDCGCTPDTIEIDLDDEKGLEPLEPITTPHGEGEAIAASIQHAVEEAEAPIADQMVR